MKLAKTPPSTPAGATAVLALIKSESEDELYSDWHEIALGTVIATLRTWALA